LTKATQLAAAMRAIGHDVLIAGGTDGGEPQAGRLALPVMGSFHSTPVPRGAGALRRLAATADVVHILGFRDPVGTIAARAAIRAGVPFVLEPVGMHRRRLRSLRLKGVYDVLIGASVIERAARIIATSQLELSEMIDDGVSPARVAIRANGVDVSDLLPLPPRGAFRAEYGIPAAVPLVLALGRITAKKQLAPLADAVLSLPDVWVAIVGPDDGDGTVERLRSEFSSRHERFRLVSEGLWGDAKGSAYADADMFCLPSATENFGNAAAEAAALGLPVVVTDRCGVSEWLDPAASRTVAFGDAAGLRAAIDRCLDPAVHDLAHERAQELREALSWDTLARGQIDIYEQVRSLVGGRRQ
jgi:glycosyltransferase involved in cell wall biosynthesis